MADVTPTTPAGVGNSNVLEVAMTATDKTTAPIQLDPRKATTIAIKTTGTATVQVDMYMEDPDNTSAVAFTYVTDAATASSVDYIKSSLGPIAGLDLTGTISGTHTATIQIIQSEVE